MGTVQRGFDEMRHVEIQALVLAVICFAFAFGTGSHAPPPSNMAAPAQNMAAPAPAQPAPEQVQDAGNSQVNAAAQAGEDAAKGMTSDGEQALKKAQEVIDAVEQDLKQQQEKSESSSLYKKK